MEGLDFLLTAICFSVLGYGLCYMTLSVNHKSETQNVKPENSLQR
ncbi:MULTISPECIES: hypothetical protein [Desulfosporosinus]|uniref:Uncharacterized protein n=1 Tax=Desulfosporosinus lacus DSM 15449 TaxID=1121420 RepID=A0A1M5ZM31_9FIRM|nr:MULTISPECIES: hypothetical protein [Desulfosporosinus]MDA8220553.1 hypothetical protein [Desulfitobacterium hafniense]SHI25188.1 hypothetical protein SAMN02746098_03386 [Desulfosporosinus lacus DSM 15449]